ncbi:MAG: hypothetical protein Q8Q73_06030 [Stagnimonas sp.]|nr:hypothetical protein [Stagnimonas sp.]
MKGRERIVVLGVASVLLLAWLGFLLHRSPRFPGSDLGSAFGIAAAVLMLMPLAYTLVKRVPWIHDRITPYVSMQSWMSLHVYAGIFGPLLAIIHTGHKFDSPLGVALTAVLLLVVVSGLAVRYLLTYVSHDIKDKLLLLQTARGDLDCAWGVLEKSAATASLLPKPSAFVTVLASLGLALPASGPAAEVTRLAESVADLEYAIRLDEFFKRWFVRALKLHIAASIAFYLLLALHIGAGLYFGLRWLQ